MSRARGFMRTPRLSEIDLTVADDVSVVAMVPVPGPHPTAHTVPCNTSERAGPRRGLRVYFNNRVVRSRVPSLRPSTQNGPASAGPRARRSAPSPKTDRPSDRGGVKTAGPGGGNTLITRESRDQPDTRTAAAQGPHSTHETSALHLQPHNPMSLSPVHAGFQSPPPGRSLFRAVRRRKVSETAPSFDVL